MGRYRIPLVLLIIGAALAAVAIFAAGKAHAAECPSIDATKAAIAAAIAKNGGTSEMLGPEDSQRYLDALNREPPQTHLAGERLIYLASPGGAVILGVVIGTRVCVAGKVSASLHERLLRAAKETKA